MSNRHLIKPPTDIILARLKILFKSLNDMYQTGGMVLEGDIISSYHEAVDLFYESFDKSITGTVIDIYAGAPSDPTQYNRLMTAVQKDIEAIFAEVAVLDRLVSSSFNSIISEREQVLETTKSITNKLGDYLLYADPSLGAGYFFGDSFNTADKLEIGSSLVELNECMADTNEGVILLPLDGAPKRPDIKSIIINKPSNGIKGSNYQLNVFGHNTIETIGDNEPNTWFEYEKVTAAESSVPLVLDLTIVLKEISVINHININPINFGTPSPVSIVAIDISKDGVEYVSIKDEIPLKDFVPEEEDNVFDLSSATSKSAGQGYYSFLPHKAQYIHIIFEQHTAYSIQTNSGIRLRYAIGLRDINILQRKFKTEGSIVSSQFTINGDTRKVSVWAAENPKELSTLSDINHFLSHNDGASWSPIQPQERIGHLIPEIVNFNNISENAITTNETVDTFRHKITMFRDTKAFSGDIVLKHEQMSYLDIVNVPSSGAFNVTLTNTPIEETVRVLMPYIGSFSCPRPRFGSSVAEESPLMDLDFVEFNVDVPASQTVPDGNDGQKIEGTVRYKLPFKGIPNLKHKLRVFHNGAQIEYLSKDEDIFTTPPTSHTTIDAYSKVYFLNKGGTELQFGYKDSTQTQRGFIPATGSRIEVCLDGDNPPISITDKGYILNLTVPSDGEEAAVSIVALKNLSESEAIPYEIEIPSGAEEFRSSNDPPNNNNNDDDGTEIPYDPILGSSFNMFPKLGDSPYDNILGSSFNMFPTLGDPPYDNILGSSFNMFPKLEDPLPSKKPTRKTSVGKNLTAKRVYTGKLTSISNNPIKSTKHRKRKK
jgi:hypothetical protein